MRQTDQGPYPPPENAHNRITVREGDRGGGLDPLRIGFFLCELIAHRLAGPAADKFNQE